MYTKSINYTLYWVNWTNQNNILIDLTENLTDFTVLMVIVCFWVIILHTHKMFNELKDVFNVYTYYFWVHKDLLFLNQELN